MFGFMEMVRFKRHVLKYKLNKVFNAIVKNSVHVLTRKAKKPGY